MEEKKKRKYVIREDVKEDAKDFDPEYKDIMKQVNKEVDENLKKRGFPKRHSLGYCHSFWSEKQKILREKYNIDWESPQDLNPEIMFD